MQVGSKIPALHPSSCQEITDVYYKSMYEKS